MVKELRLQSVFLLVLGFLAVTVYGQMIVASEGVSRADLKIVAPTEEVLDYTVVSQEEMDNWPVDRVTSEEDLGEESLKRYFTWNIWPNRAVFEVGQDAEIVRGEAVWRRSALAIRQKGLKLVSAETGEKIYDARLISYDQERVVIDFRPTTGKGTYYLYYGAFGGPIFKPSKNWLTTAEQTETPVAVKAERIEARCKLDSFYPMEIVPLEAELERFRELYSSADYLVFPQDRDHSIKMVHEIPAEWVFRNPDEEFVIAADCNEYRVFQLGVWACNKNIEDLKFEFTDFKSRNGETTIPAEWFQCLTTTSKIKSMYIEKPKGPFNVPQGQLRVFWIGVDLPDEVKAGEYKGFVTVKPANSSEAKVPVSIKVSKKIVARRGDHDLWRLSKLRWLESDLGISDEVFEPFEALRLSRENRVVSTWGHTLELNEFGLPSNVYFGSEEIMAGGVEVAGKVKLNELNWRGERFRFTEATDGHVCWEGAAKSGDLKLTVEGRIDFDGCIVVDVSIESEKSCDIDDLVMTAGWRKEHAQLASGMGYSGRRQVDRVWRRIRRERACYGTAGLWLGSVKAGLGWITWYSEPWEDVSRVDAAEITEEADRVVMQLNLGDHNVGGDKKWQMRFALRPTPIKPVDKRHWQFRYLHKGGDYRPSDKDTPHSFLKDDCKRLEEMVELGVKRLNLHDWWGPSFNYPWQWERHDNLSKLTEEAHKRGIYVKVYNSGKALSTLAPEFWALLYTATEYNFDRPINPNQKGRFQDGWFENHLPDGLAQAWPRLHDDLGNEHSVRTSNAMRIGNFYIESMLYMVENFGIDGAYFDGADGSSLGHREMCKRLWTMFKKSNPNALIDAHHGTTGLGSCMINSMVCLPFIDSIWHGETFDYEGLDPWQWLVEISGIPFGIPSEMLGKEKYFARGMLFGIWPRMGWCAGTKQQEILWKFFNKFEIEEAEMLGWWESDNGITLDRHSTYATAFVHKENGVLVVIASWHPKLAGWVDTSIDVSLKLSREKLGLGDGELVATDIMSKTAVDITRPIVLSKPKNYTHFKGRLIWVKNK
ncbi:MAG: glycoside hydrolase domain-containing protein [Planctomycetota bacterium]|jgi:hypothetical protein